MSETAAPVIEHPRFRSVTLETIPPEIDEIPTQKEHVVEAPNTEALQPVPIPGIGLPDNFTAARKSLVEDTEQYVREGAIDRVIQEQKAKGIGLPRARTLSNAEKQLIAEQKHVEAQKHREGDPYATEAMSVSETPKQPQRRNALDIVKNLLGF